MAGPYGQQNRDLIGGSLSIRGKTVLTSNATLNAKNVNISGQTIEFTKTIGPNYCPCVIQNWKADTDIAAARVLKIGARDFTVTEVLSDDAEETGVIGVSTTAALANSVVKVCTSGIFSIEVEANVSVTAGDTLYRSTNEDGKVDVSGSAIGTFAVALESTPGSDPSPIIKAIFIKSENY